MTAMRQLGWVSGCAEALAIFHQLFYDEWVAGSVNALLATLRFLRKNALV